MGRPNQFDGADRGRLDHPALHEFNPSLRCRYRGSSLSQRISFMRSLGQPRSQFDFLSGPAKSVSAALCLALILIVTPGCSKTSAIRGSWYAPTGASLEITSDQFIARGGPLQFTVRYKVERTDGNIVTVSLDDGSGRPSRAMLVVEGSRLKINGSGYMPVFGGTWTRQNSTNNTASNPAPVQSQPIATPAPFDDRGEALEQAETRWKQIWVNDGDTWIARAKDKSYLMQIKGRRSEVEADSLTEADGLNEIQWRGTVKFYRSAQRLFGFDSNRGSLSMNQHDPGWNEWTSESEALAVYRFQKQRNNWRLLENGLNEVASLDFGRDDMVLPSAADLRAAGINNSVRDNDATVPQTSQENRKSDVMSIAGTYICCERGTCFYLTLARDGYVRYRCEPSRSPMTSAEPYTRTADTISNLSASRYTIQGNGDLLQIYNSQGRMG